MKTQLGSSQGVMKSTKFDHYIISTEPMPYTSKWPYTKVYQLWTYRSAQPGINRYLVLNTLRLRQNGRHFADDTFKRIFVNENIRISIKISFKFVPKGPINNNPALVQIMAWRRSGGKPLSEPMVVSLLTHICVTRPQWVKYAERAISGITEVTSDIISFCDSRFLFVAEYKDG